MLWFWYKQIFKLRVMPDQFFFQGLGHLGDEFLGRLDLLVPQGPHSPGQRVPAAEGAAAIPGAAGALESPVLVIKDPVVVGGLFAFLDVPDHDVVSLPGVQDVGVTAMVHVFGVAAGHNHRAVPDGVGMEQQLLLLAGRKFLEFAFGRHFALMTLEEHYGPPGNELFGKKPLAFVFNGLHFE